MKPVSFWNEKHIDYSSKNWINKPAIFAQEAVSFFPRRGKLLDLGAGQGQDSRYFAHLGYDVVSTDFSETALGLSRKKAKEEKLKFKILMLDISAPLPFKSEEFDIVYSHLALHYWDKEKTKRIFNEILRVLKTGGVFAAIFNSIYDPEVVQLRKIGQNLYFEDKIKMARSYFSVPYMDDLIDDNFSIKMIDEKGRTYKDINEKLFRFIGLKK
jgi:SAM-dependent methyltransferase